MGGAGSARRDDIVRFVKAFTKRYRHAPTIAEIAEELDIGTSTAWFHVVKLKDEGRLTFEPKTPRTIKVVKEALPSV